MPQSSGCHRGGPGSIPDNFLWDLCWKNGTGTGFFFSISTFPVSIVSPVHHAPSVTYHRHYVRSAIDSVFK
jgi:hypothetical protein